MYTTLSERAIRRTLLRQNEVLTLFDCAFQRNYRRGTRLATPEKITTGDPVRSAHFQIGLFELHSPLLIESWLFSFPLLNNKLKFRRSFYSISDLYIEGCGTRMVFSLSLSLVLIRLIREKYFAGVVARRVNVSKEFRFLT